MIGYASTPAGWTRVIMDGDLIQSVHFVDNKEVYGDFSEIPESLEPLFSRACHGLGLSRLKTNGTSFQKAVWRELSSLKTGETQTYGEIAARLGNGKWARAVGSACALNQHAMVIPCHRVLSAKGLGQYKWGINRKANLLEWERRNLFKPFFHLFRKFDN